MKKARELLYMKVKVSDLAEVLEEGNKHLSLPDYLPSLHLKPSLD